MCNRDDYRAELRELSTKIRASQSWAVISRTQQESSKAHHGFRQDSGSVPSDRSRVHTPRETRESLPSGLPQPDCSRLLRRDDVGPTAASTPSANQRVGG